MTEPDFWDDNIAAQKTSQELNELKQTYENFHQMTDLFDESEILLEFLSEDESVHEELEEKLIELDKMMTSYEMTLLLSEPYDNNNAILEIHPGSGGTEAQDWEICFYGCIPASEMLMASRWKSWTTRQETRLGLNPLPCLLKDRMPMAC